MRFVNEFWLYLVLLLPLLWLGLRAADRRAASRLTLLLGPQASRHVEGANPRVRTWRRFLAFAGAFWVLLALAQPQWGAREVSVTQRGSDIVVALDISNSMLAQDVPPNRMESAKGELASFLERLENSRVGLVFFAGSAFVQCPLTMDYGTAEIFLRMAGPDMMSEQGTAIGAALEASRGLLAKGRGAEERGNFQAILLVTDGEDLEGDWERAAAACVKDGIKVIPVGVGEESGGLIPVQDAQGRDAGFMKDDQGSLVMSRLDLASLEKIAGLSSGSTFRIGVDGLAGDRLFAELQRLGRRDLEERRISSYQDRYLWPLVLGLLCFALEMLLFSRSAAAAAPGGRAADRRLTLSGLLVAALGLGWSVPAQAGIRPPGAAEAEAGRRLYEAGQFEEALARFQEALVLAPEDPKISLALGEALFKLERYQEAEAEFDRARALAEDPQIRAEALYNGGTTQLAAGDPQKAVGQLRESLQLDPDSPDTRHNLEVALRRLQQQQQQQQQDQEKQEQQEKQEKQEEQEKQEKQEEQEQQDQENQDQENQDQENQEDQDQQQQDQQQQEEQQQQQEEQQSQPQDQELTQDQALQILKALDRDEEELKRSVQKRLKGGKPRSGKKW